MQTNSTTKKNGDKKTLAHNTIALMIIQVLNYVIPFITIPYVSRIFEVEKFGVIFFAQALMDYFMRFVMFGFELSGVRTIAIKRDNPNEVNKVFNSVLSIQILFLAISFILLSLIIIFFPRFRQDSIIYFFTFLSLIGQVLLFTWFYQGMEKMKFITTLNVITRIISLILIFSCIRKPEDYILYPLFNSFALIIAGIISIIFIKKYFSVEFFIPKLKDSWDVLKYSSGFFVARIAMALYRQTNVFVLGLVTTTTIVAYFVSADRIFCAAMALCITFVNALFPYMSKNKDILFYKKMIKYLLVFSILASVFLLLISKLLIFIFYSEKYLDAVNILRIFIVSFTFFIFVDVLGFPLLGAFGYVKETNMGNILGGIYNALGLLILYYLNSINLYSVAIIASSTYLVMFLHRIYYINKYKLFNLKDTQ